jgi:hypothetical protein
MATIPNKNTARRQSPTTGLVLHRPMKSPKGIKGRSQIVAPLDPLAPLPIRPRNPSKLIPLDTVRDEKIRWLVPGLVPLGSITILDGAKAEGKSTVIYDWAARVTSDKPMPFSDGDPVSGGVILLQTEDDLGATVRKSIEMAGGDPSRVHVFSKRDTLYLDDPEDLQLIQKVSKEIGAKLLVADPVSEFFSKPLLNEKVIRESFRLIRAMAESLGMAVIFIRHFTKTGRNP